MSRPAKTIRRFDAFPEHALAAGSSSPPARPGPWKVLTLVVLAVAAIFASATGQSPAVSLDSDGDGLSDQDEIAIYGTNPRAADTDHDGQSDGDEVRAGTDPLSPDSFLRILGSPESLSGGTWRVRWSSVTGRAYLLQSSGDIAGPWHDVARVTATGAVSGAVDSNPALGPRGFYRVMVADLPGAPVLSEPVPLPGGGWRFSWTSQTGQVYRLERTALMPPALLSWESVATVLATGPTAVAEDHTPAAGLQQFYRVALVDTLPDTVPPVVSSPVATPSPVAAEGVVVLDVTATDDQAVQAVQFLDGTTSLGAAVRVNATTWRLLWTVSATQNGSHSITARATDPSGNGATSPALAVGVSIGQAQQGGPFGRVQVKADTMATNGVQITPAGHVRVGIVLLTSPVPPTIASAQQLLTGSGPVTIPGLGTVFNGAFQLDLSTGILGPALGFAGPFDPIELSPRVHLRPRSLQVNVESGALSGEGAFQVQVGGDPNSVAVLDGSFVTDPAAQTVAIHSKTDYAGVTGTGDLTLHLADTTFEQPGTVVLKGSASTEFTLQSGVLRLQNGANGSVGFQIEGSPNLAVVAGLGIRLEGSMDTAGKITLKGTGSGALGAMQFAPLQLTLTREAPDKPVELHFTGTIQVPNLAYTALSGTIKSDGSLANVASSAEVELGNGLRIQPRKDDKGVVQPVVSLVSSVNGVQTFKVSGTFLTPEAGGVKPVEVEGPMVLENVGGTANLRSFVMTNRLPMLKWPLPSQIKMEQASVVVLYTNAQFMARLRGGITLSLEPTGPVTIETDLGMQINPSDPTDVVIDDIVRIDGVGVMKQVYLGTSKFEFYVGTKPPRATLALLDGNVGFLPKVEIPPSTNNDPASAGAKTNAALSKIKKENFQLFFEHVGAYVEFEERGFTTGLTNGLLHLPALFTNLPPGVCPGQSSGPSIALRTNSAVIFSFHTDPEPGITARAEGALNFTNIVVIPNLDGWAAELCHAQLFFNPGGFPYLTNLDGTMIFPFRNETNRMQILNGAWGLDGWPSGTVALASDLHLITNESLSITLLGRGNAKCMQGLSITAFPAAPGLPPKLKLTGGVDVTLPADAVTDVEGDRVHMIACGVLILNPATPLLPELQLPQLSVGGTFHIGGEKGLVLSNALLTLRDPENFFQLAPGRTAGVGVQGVVYVANGPAFSLQDARFTWFDPDRLPKFTVKGMGYSEAQFEAIRKIPMRVTSAEFAFKSADVELPFLLHPTNVVLRFSAHMALPNDDDPVVAGTIENMKVSFPANAPPQVDSLHSLTFQIGKMKMPPMDAIRGALHIRDDNVPFGTLPAPADVGLPAGLPQLPSDPTKLFFAGSIEGTFDSYKLKVLMAMSLSGVEGVCLDFNAGNVGVPLDGGTLGGILLSGASGGVAFNRGDADPCDFTAWLDSDGKPKPGVIGFPPIKISWEDLQGKIKTMEEKASAFHDWLAEHHALPAPALQSLEGPQLASVLPATRYTNEFGLPCPGNCPPPTVNIFCQPHPDADKFGRRIIFKFSSIDEPTLNSLGFTRDWVRSQVSTGGDWVNEVAGGFVVLLRDEVLARTPKPDPQKFGGQAAQQLLDIINKAINQMAAAFQAEVADHIATESNADTIYEKVRDLAYQGAPCQDISLSVSGTFTYEVVSSFLSGTVGASLTTAGNAGINGHINLFGVPVGNGKLFVAATDDKGNPNASVCGQADVSFGPFSLGAMRAAYDCQGCAESYRDMALSVFKCLGDNLVRPLAAKYAPEIVDVAQKDRFQLAAEMTQQELMAAILEVFTNPSLQVAARNCFRNEVQTFIDRVNPEMLMCGEVRPRAFGIGLGPSFMSGGMTVNKHGFVGVGSYSPSFTLAMPFIAAAGASSGGSLALAAGPLATSLFAQDEATYGFALEIPDPAQMVLAGLSGDLGSPAALEAFTERQFNMLLENATYTFNYTLSPLGFRTVDAQSRLVMPNFLHHPAEPGSTWKRPEDRTDITGLPSRLDLVVSALTNHLPGSSLGLIADPQWKGTATDLDVAFAGTPLQGKVHGMSFQDDYFPHGGMLGGAFIQVPRALYETPPDEFYVAINPTNNMLARLSAAAGYVFDYVLKSHQAGNIGFYIPAPNPPFFTDAQGHRPTPRQMMDALQQFDPANMHLIQLYPFDQFFLKGYFDGQLLGIPVAQGTIEAALADPAVATQGLLRVTANVPHGSWLDPFVSGARVIFEMKGAPPAPIEVTFSNLLAQITTGTNGASDAALGAMMGTVMDQFEHSMPKVKLEADLPLTMPAPISDVLKLTSQTHLYAYSPRYEPGFQPQNTGPLARVHREGGIAFQGYLDLRVNGTTIASVKDAELSVVPVAGGAPQISGKFLAGRLNLVPVGLNAVDIDFNSAPNPHFSGRGSVDPINIGPLFQMKPLLGPSVTGKVDVVRTGTDSAKVSFSISPARLELPLLSPQSLLLHGTTRNDPFTFSTTDPWTASAEITNDFSLSAGGITLVSISGGTLASPFTFSGTGTSTGSVTVGFAPVETTLTVFPGTAYAQTLVLPQGNPTGHLIIRSDKTFELTGTLKSDLAWGGNLGLPVLRTGAGASFTLTQDALSVTGVVDGGVLGSAGAPGATATATVTIARDGTVTFTGSGSLTFPALGAGLFHLEGPQGQGLTAALDSTGLAFQGGRIRVDGLMTNPIAAFHMAANGDFGVHFGPVAGTFAGYGVSRLEGQVGRTNNTWSIQGLGVDMALPAATPPVTATLTGDLATDGTFVLRGNLNLLGGVQFSGIPVSRLNGKVTVVLQRTLNPDSSFLTRLQVTGTATLPALTGFGAPASSLTISLATDGTASLNALTSVPAATFGIFRISGAKGGPIVVQVTDTVSFPNGFELRITGLGTAGSDLQVLSETQPLGFLADGSYSITFTGPSLSVGGFTFPAPTLTFSRVAGGPPSLTVSGNLNDASGVFPSLALLGSVSTAGEVRLGFTNQTASIGGFPYGGLNAALVKQSGKAGSLSLDGQVNVPSFASARMSGNATADPGGLSVTLHYGGDFSLGGFDLAAGTLDLNAPAGGTKSFTVNGGITIPGLDPLTLNGGLDTSGSFAISNTLGAGHALATFPVASLVSTLSRGPGDYAAQVLADKPLAYWRMNESSGTILVTAVNAKSFAGTYEGKVPPFLHQPGAMAGSTSVGFSGSQDARVLTSTAFSALANAMTVEAWVRVGAFDRSFQTIISKGDSSWRLQRSASANVLSFDTDGVNPPYLAGSRSVNDGQWHHVVASYDGRAKYLYIDGQLDAWTPATGKIQSNTYDMLIGDNAQATGRGWNGWLDEVALYARALTPGEVLAHYRQGGGVTLAATMRLGFAGMDVVDLSGSFDSSGAMDLKALPASVSVGGFGLQNALLRFSRMPGGTASLLVEGDLSIPHLSAFHMQGSVTEGAAINLTATPGSVQIADYTFTAPSFQLTGSASTGGSLSIQADLPIPAIGSIPFHFTGTFSGNGDFGLTSTPSFDSLFSFPISAGTLNSWFESHSMSYSAMVAGALFNTKDIGDNPLAYWRLNETSGTTVNDRKKSSLSRPAVGGTYVGGVTLGEPGGLSGDQNVDPSARFDGVSGYAVMSQESRFDFTQAVTVEAWLKVAAWDRTWQAIVTKGDTSWRLARYGNSSQVSFDTTSASAQHSVPGQRALDDGKWHHVVGVYDGMGKYLYVDGILEGFAPYTETLNVNNAPVMIGENAEATGRFFNGWIDEVAVYDHPLTPAQVLNHYKAGGSARLATSLRLTLPNGFDAVDLSGVLDPAGALSLYATPASVALPFLSLSKGRLAFTRVPGGTAGVQARGTVGTGYGDVDFWGSISTDGNYSFQSAATGSLALGSYNFNYTAGLKLEPSQLTASGTVTYGSYSFFGAFTRPSSGNASFSASTSGSTDWIHFGFKPTLSGLQPAAPDGRVSWNASANFDGSNSSFTFKIDPSLDIRDMFDVIWSYHLPVQDLQLGGQISLKTPVLFVDPNGTKRDSFCFDLINKSKCP